MTSNNPELISAMKLFWLWGPPHRHDALGDILVLEKLFERLFTKMSKDIGPAAVEDKMMDISSKPVLLSRMYFGKHKGERFRDIPVDYLQWLSGKDDLDLDIIRFLLIFP